MILTPLVPGSVHFGTGEITPQPVELIYPRVRCVRTERTPKSLADSSSTRYSRSSSTVIDRSTGLIWHRTGTKDCAKITDRGGGFRTPHIKELLTIVAATKASRPYVDPDAFSADLFRDDVLVSVKSDPSASSGIGYRLDFGNRGRVRLLSGSSAGAGYIPCVRSADAAGGSEADGGATEEEGTGETGETEP